tara:strand:+ start:58 stop:333 length:276 start_codon:yes stop_codon:yes gene_type:complete
MNKLDTQQQLFVIMMEECGELIQQCSKCLRQQFDLQDYESDHNRKKLIEEVGDVYAMIELMVKNNIITWASVYNRSDVKKEKLKQWSDLIQ